MATTDLDIKGILVGSSRKFRKEVLSMPIVALEDSLKYMTIRYGIRGEEVVGAVNSGAQLRPYRTAKDATNTSELYPRLLKTYLGDVVEEFDPVAIYETCYSEPIAKKRTELEIVRTLCLEMSRQCSENLGLALFKAERDATGETTMDLFNGYDTIIAAEVAAGNIATAKGNLAALGDITVANVGDKLLAFYRGAHQALKTKKNLYLYLPIAVKEMYEDWFAANFNGSLYNKEYEKHFLHGSDKRVELVALPGMLGVDYLFLSTRKNILVGCDQMSDKEKFEINKCDNPKVVQFFMTMYFGVEFESIDQRLFLAGSFNLVLPGEEEEEEPVVPVVPGIALSEESLAFGEVVANLTKDLTVVLTGENLTADLGIQVDGEKFSADISTADKDNVMDVAGVTVTVTFAPTAAGALTGTLRIFSATDGIIKEIALTGTGTTGE